MEAEAELSSLGHERFVLFFGNFVNGRFGIIVYRVRDPQYGSERLAMSHPFPFCKLNALAATSQDSYQMTVSLEDRENSRMT